MNTSSTVAAARSSVKPPRPLAGGGTLTHNRTMNTPEARPNLYGMDLPELSAVFEALGEKSYRARQAITSMYRQDLLDPAAWTTFSARLRREIAERYRVERPRISERQLSDDGSVKVVLALADGQRVEAVAMPTDERMTFCISSQAGCAFGCAFCMTAKLGFLRHLSVGEIVGQVAALMEETGTAHERYNIVFMGMGEPLHNLENLLGALHLLLNKLAFGLGPKRLTVSTVGIPEGIDRLGQEEPRPRLAVSIISAEQATREELMPSAKNFKLDAIADAMRRFGARQRDLPTIEAVMLKGINDQRHHAEALAKFALRAGAKVNLIEFNPTPELPFEPSSEDAIQRTLRILVKAGVGGTVRRSRGRDIAGACGQLALKKQ